MSPAQIAARVIPAIGRPDFPDRLLGALRDLAECEFCSAFAWDAQSGPRLLFAVGVHPQMPQFAIAASRAYAEIYWRLDVVAREGITKACGSSLVRMTADDIGDADYRRECYQKAGICERLTLLDAGSRAISASGYRTVLRGPATSRVVRRMQEAGPTLIAALRRHTELVEHAAQASSVPSLSVLLKRLCESGLSAREAQVAAGLAMGWRQTDIARNAGLALNSVITYRRRAYQKLKVSDRLELRALCTRMAASAEP